MVLAAWYAIEPSRNLERFAKPEKSSTSTAPGCCNAPEHLQAKGRAVSRAGYPPELPEQLMAAAAPALGTLLFAQEFNGHVEVLHPLQPELRPGCLHQLLQLLSTHHGSQHVQNLHTHRARGNSSSISELLMDSGLPVWFATAVMSYLIILNQFSCLWPGSLACATNAKAGQTPLKPACSNKDTAAHSQF